MANINTATMKGDLNALTIGGTIKANQPIKANVILGGGGGGGELEQRVAALEEQVIVINQNMSSLQDDIDTINRDVSALTDRVLINETDINTLNVDVADLKAAGEELATRVTVAEQTLGALQIEVNSLSTRLDNDEIKITALTRRLDNIQTVVDALSDEVSTLQSNITDLQTRMSNIESGIITLAAAIQDAEQDISTLQTDLMAVEGDVAGLQADVSTLQSDVTTLQRDVLVIQSDLEDKISKDTLATSSTLGLVKLYNETGNNEDGTLTQKAATNSINNALTIANQAEQAAGIAITNAAQAVNIAETDNTSTSAGRVASGAGQVNRVWGTDDNGNPSWTKPTKVYDASGSTTIWSTCEVRYYRGDHTLPTLLWNVPNTPWISNFIYTVVLDGSTPISIEANPIDYSTKAYIWNANSNWIALN